MSLTPLQSAILDFVAAQAPVGARAIQERVGRPRPTVNRALAALVQDGYLLREGAGPALTYRLAQDSGLRVAEPDAPAYHSPRPRPYAAQHADLKRQLQAPLGTRQPVTYQRRFVDSYQPNVTSLLPPTLAESLWQQGRSQGQQPAGTYARKVLEQLLIDLSWSSSRLEGNRKSLLDTQELFARGRSAHDDWDATMLLNHKEAIEFMVDAVPTEGMTVPVVRNLQSLLMRDLLPDAADLGAIRQTIVQIQDSVYLPSQMPQLLEEMLGLVVTKAQQVRNPLEAAFFLWVNIAYLQPFVDGNKRTSRLSANLPLLLANCAPLSFLDVEPADYALAMLGVYELLDVRLAVELFDWTYRRSIAKYHTVLQAMGGPDPLRARYREQLSSAIQQVVFFGQTLAQALASVSVAPEDKAAFTALLQTELSQLQPYNCARYRLPISKTQAWIECGRLR